MKRNTFKWSMVAVVLAFGIAFSLTSAALPFPPEPGQGIMVVSYLDSSGEVVGQRFYGSCPGPYPLPWGNQNGNPSISYISCGDVGPIE